MASVDYDKYEMTVGIECHVQLATATKLFSPADNDARDKEPNAVVHPVDYGLPGMLPILNRQAVDLAIRAGKALNAEVARVSRFDRKHYFYPDLPKGYQTTQMYQPIIGEGYVDVPLENSETVRVRIHHAHMEEDAGKLTHYGGLSLVDLNRAGTPLIEIVSEPDIHSAAVARAFATELYRLMTFAGVTHGDLYHGNMRFDVNISVALKGATELGKRTEVKNLNSFRSVERAAQYEFERQVDLLERGEVVKQETRGWVDDNQITVSQRSKEDAQDYRYMPDADIPPVVLTDEQIAAVQSQVPALPNDYREHWREFNFDYSTTEILLSNIDLANLIDAVALLDETHRRETLADLGIKPESHSSIVRRIVNWFTSTPSEQMDFDKLASGLVGPRRLILLAQLAEEAKISSTSAKELFLYLFDEASKGSMPEDIAKDKNLLQVSDEGEIAAVVDAVLQDPASQKAVEDIRSGNDKAIGYLVGQVMKQSQGKANPALAQKLIRDRL